MSILVGIYSPRGGVTVIIRRALLAVIQGVNFTPEISKLFLISLVLLFLLFLVVLKMLHYSLTMSFNRMFSRVI